MQVFPDKKIYIACNVIYIHSGNRDHVYIDGRFQPVCMMVEVLHYL